MTAVAVKWQLRLSSVMAHHLARWLPIELLGALLNRGPRFVVDGTKKFDVLLDEAVDRY